MSFYNPPPSYFGTVTSVDVSGGTTGLTTSGGPITTSGTITLAGTLGPANGGTGVVNNAASTITITGAYSLGMTLTGATNVTFPTTGTLAVVGDPVLEPFTSKTANYTITTTDSTVLCLTNSFTLTLPTAVGLTGRKFTVKNANTLASGNTITMATTSAQTIDGSAPGSLTPLVTQTFQSDGANWWII